MKLTKQNLTALVQEVLAERMKHPDFKVIKNGDRLISVTRLNEASIAGIKGKYMKNGFIVISSDRSCEAELGLPEGEKCPDKEAHFFNKNNIENRKIIKQWVRSKGFGFTPVYGGYREKLGVDDEGKDILSDNDTPEHSLLIMARSDQEGQDIESLKKLAMALCHSFNQDAFFLKPPDAQDTAAYFVTRDGDIDMKFRSFAFGDLEQIYYTQLAKKRGQSNRFSAIPEGKIRLYLPKHPATVSEARMRMGEIFITKLGD